MARPPENGGGHSGAPARSPRCSRRRALGLAIVAVLILGGCRRRSPDIVVVLVDTLRADRLSAAGGTPGLTPFLDSLAASGTLFTNAYSTSSWTNPAVASLFTSRYPSQHRVARFDSRLADEEVTLAERLHASGYRCVGMVGNFRLLGALGFGQGFDAWFPHVSARKVRAHRIAQDTIRFYDRRMVPGAWSRWTRRPLFLYLHFMEPHAPYDPPATARRGRVGPPPPGSSEAAISATLVEGGRTSELSEDEVAYLASLYDAEVAGLDARLARLFRRLRARGVLDHATIVVVGDHGEEFREHGGLMHGTTLYEESVRIPLLLVGTGVPAGRVVTDPVSIVDIAPTVLDVVGLPPEPRFEGRSLLGDLAPTPGSSHDVVLELLPTGRGVDTRRHAAGLLHDGLKVLMGPLGGRPEAYDLRHDPRETRQDPPALAAETPVLRARLAERLGVFAASASTTAETVPLDDAQRARLRALGYAD